MTFLDGRRVVRNLVETEKNETSCLASDIESVSDSRRKKRPMKICTTSTDNDDEKMPPKKSRRSYSTDSIDSGECFLDIFNFF